MATITITQPEGAGSPGVGESLEGAWLGVDVSIALSNEGAGSTYLHEILNPETHPEGLSATLTNASTRVATLAVTSAVGSIRVRSTVTDPDGAVTAFVRVYSFTKNSSGDTIGLALPAFGERPGERTVDARGAAGVFDRLMGGLFSGLEQTQATRIVRVDRTSYQLLEADALGEVSFVIDTSGHSLGATRVLVVPAGEVVSADNFSVPPGLAISGDAFDPTSTYAIVLTCVDASTPGTFIASAFTTEARATTAPTIVAASIPGGGSDLILEFDRPVWLASLVDVTLLGTDPALDSISAVSADKTTWTIALDGAIGGATGVTLDVGSANTWRSLDGGAFAADVIDVTTEYDFAAVPNATLWFDPPLACDVTTDGGSVTALNTTVGAGQDFTGTGTYRATGMNGRPGLEGNGTSNVFNTSSLVSALLSASEFYILGAINVDAISSDSGTAYINVGVLTDAAAYGPGLHFRQTGTKAQLYMYDGSGNQVTETTISLDVVTVFSLRLKAGNLYLGINGVESAGIACGNVQAAALASTLRLLRGGGGGGGFFDGMLGRLLICNADPGATIRGEAEAALVAFYA